MVSEVPDPQPGDGQQVFDVLAAGVNYADTHQTENSYLAAQTLPMIPGSEVVVRGADGARLLGLPGTGGYAEQIALDPRTLFPVPDEVSDGAALTTLVQGATAWHLLRTSTHLAAGESVVVHAGAGGVGTIAIQLAKLWGAGRVIATASSPEKRQVALDLGADAVVDSRAADLTAALRAANGGDRVDVVLEMTGGSVFDQSLAALAPLGRLAVFGMAGRTPPSPIDARVADVAQPGGDRLLAGARHAATGSARRRGHRPAVAHRRRGSCGRSSVPPIRSTARPTPTARCSTAPRSASW